MAKIKISMELDEELLTMIDEAANKLGGMSRSAFIRQAAIEKMQRFYGNGDNPDR